MTTIEAIERISAEEDFIALKRFNYSLKMFLERYPDGSPNNRIIAQALMMTEDDVESLYQEILEKLRAVMIDS